MYNSEARPTNIDFNLIRISGRTRYLGNLGSDGSESVSH